MTISLTIATARLAAVLLVLVVSLVHSAVFAQADTSAISGKQDPALFEPPLPAASNGGKAQLLPPQPISESADPVNQRVAAETVDGLILAITIDGTSVTLDAAKLARIPRRMARADRVTGGDTVKATALAGGQVIATTVVPDTVLNASEGEGLVRTTRRQITLVLAADRPIDTVTIEAPATGASASLDLRPAYSSICDADRSSKWCPRR